jgi:hypothetical protein
MPLQLDLINDNNISSDSSKTLKEDDRRQKITFNVKSAFALQLSTWHNFSFSTQNIGSHHITESKRTSSAIIK